MSNKYPYVASAGPLVKTISQLRKSFPKELTAETLRKIGVAPKNESYVINVLRFLNIIDDEGKQVQGKSDVMHQHQDAAFSKEFSALVEEAYEELFELHGTDTWKLDRNALTQFFRTTDRSSEVVGSRQAATFSALAALSGHAEVPAPKTTTNAKKPKPITNPEKKPGKKVTGVETQTPPHGTKHGEVNQNLVGLTVRVEVNLPAGGDQETYDRIFQSIRKNLINGN